ncbi:hypothetical protein TRICI_005465 [Trichomonascus ciferrii]|uniref:HORMA domain-containing protein n=1 Tax=Trichomonascus ciferrii TaxID=44093 RepID=A0A642US53_9ASCO|nr:hypothetical protein TRICI_005465 [Trichomonascus ciferrii]
MDAPEPCVDTQNASIIEDVVRYTFISLAFLRGIFSEVCFNDKVIEFDECQSQSQSSQQQSKTIRLKTLPRNRSQAADLYNSWVDSIIKVLRDGHLQSIILNIYNDQKLILECFTLELTSKSIDLKIRQGSDRSTTTVLQEFGFAKIMKRFIATIQTLPDLSETAARLVEMIIVHNSTTPPSYKVHEFATTTTTTQPNTRVQISSSSCQQTLLYDTGALPNGVKANLSCECGAYESDSKHLIKCSSCGYYVHASCYGFLGIRRPHTVKIVCFTCLHATTPELLYVAKTIILLRRVTKLRPPKNGLKPSYTQTISSKLGIPLQASSLLHTKLKELGYYSPSGKAYRKKIDPILFANTEKNTDNHPYSSVEPSLVQQLKNTGVFKINYRSDIDSIST